MDLLSDAKMAAKSGRHKEAIEKYNKLIRDNPEDNIAYQGLGFSLMSLKRYEDAILAFQKALTLDPNIPSVHCNLGVIFWQQRRYPESETELRTAIELDPKFHRAYLNLATILRKQKRFQEAEDILRQALKVDAQNSETYQALAICYIQQGHYVDARNLAQRAFALSPSSSTQVFVIISYLGKYGTIAYALLFLSVVAFSYVSGSWTVPLVAIFAGTFFVSGSMYLRVRAWRRGGVDILVAILFLVAYIVMQVPLR